jgi:chromosome partitioning protein
MGEHRAPVGVYAPSSDAAKAFSSLWKRVRRAHKGSRVGER